MTIRRILLTAYNLFSPNQIFNIIHLILKLTPSQQVNRNVYPAHPATFVNLGSVAVQCALFYGLPASSAVKESGETC